MSRPSRRAWAGLVVSLALLATACADGEPEATPSPGATTDAAPSPSPSSPPSPSPSPSPAASPTDFPAVAVEPVVTDLSGPVLVTAPDGDPRLFVVELPGTVRIVRDGQLLPEPFLDISSLVQVGGERGLLGLGFHPDYAENGRFYVHHSAAEDGGTRLAEYRVSADSPDRADPDSRRLLLSVDQPAANHNGGTVAFGPDGYLYLGLGDGGGSRDRFGQGQDPSTLLATLLRLDVDREEGGRPYAIPPDNPFASGAGGAPEVWAYGLRNPWRFGFDGDLLYIADVGQGAREEIDIQPAGAAGLNYGWSIMEGTTCLGAESCEQEGLVLPAHEYAHGEGVCGVIGGYVYRGQAIPELVGAYLYGELCGGWVRALRYVDGEVTADAELLSAEQVSGAQGYRILSFGRDSAGELYVLTADGAVLRLVAGASDAA